MGKPRCNRYHSPVPLPSRPDKHRSVQIWDMAGPAEGRALAVVRVSPAHMRRRRLQGRQL